MKRIALSLRLPAFSWLRPCAGRARRTPTPDRGEGGHDLGDRDRAPRAAGSGSRSRTHVPDDLLQRQEEAGGGRRRRPSLVAGALPAQSERTELLPTDDPSVLASAYPSRALAFKLHITLLVEGKPDTPPESYVIDFQRLGARPGAPR
jgi:hypothetical protein